VNKLKSGLEKDLLRSLLKNDNKFLKYITVNTKYKNRRHYKDLIHRYLLYILYSYNRKLYRVSLIHGFYHIEYALRRIFTAITGRE